MSNKSFPAITHYLNELLARHILAETNLKLDAIEKAIGSSSHWWENLFIAGFGAFFGATTAFYFNYWHEQQKTVNERNDALNEAIQLFSINTERLLLFKSQFLTAFKPEFSQLKEFTIESQNLSHDSLRGKWKSKYSPMLNDLEIKYADNDILKNLNGLLKRKWISNKTISFEIKKISFISNEIPDVLQFALEAINQMASFEDCLIERNLYREENDKVFSQEPEDIRENMKVYYELIDLREHLEDYVNRAVVLMQGVNICLAKYQDNHFFKGRAADNISKKKRKKKHTRVRYKLPIAAKDAFPNPRDYKILFRSQADFIFQEWDQWFEKSNR